MPAIVLAHRVGPVLLHRPWVQVPRIALCPRASWGGGGRGDAWSPLSWSCLPSPLRRRLTPPGPVLWAYPFKPKQNSYCSQESSGHSETPSTCPVGLGQPDITRRPVIIHRSFVPAAPLGFPGGASGKEPACQCRKPESGRSPGVGNGYPLQYSCLENPMDRGACLQEVTKSRTWLKWLSKHTAAPLHLKTAQTPPSSSGKAVQSAPVDGRHHLAHSRGRTG